MTEYPEVYWIDWLVHTHLTFGELHTYHMFIRIRARYWAAIPAIGLHPFEVYVDDFIPETTMYSLPECVQKGNLFVVGWWGNDYWREFLEFDIQYNQDLGDWTDWITHTAQLSETFIIDVGQIYSFRGRATDPAGNIGEWSNIVTTNLRPWTPTPTALETTTPTDTETPTPTVSETPTPTISETPTPTVSETPTPTTSEDIHANSL